MRTLALALARVALLIWQAFWLWLTGFLQPGRISPTSLHANNQFLRGGFGPIAEEHRGVRLAAERSEADGDNDVLPRTVPEDFPAGMFVRNGPNPRWTPLRPHHWFDGDGHLHSVYFPAVESNGDEDFDEAEDRKQVERRANGAAFYTNAYVRTQRFQDEQAAGGPLYSGLADVMSPERLLLLIVNQALQKLGIKRKLTGKSVANTNIVFHDRKLLSLVEADHPYIVHAPSLNTIGPHNWDGRVSRSFTAHPKIDERTGEMIGFMYAFDAPFCQYYLVNSHGSLEIIHNVDIPVPVMMHDMAASARFSLLLDLPITFRVERVLEGKSPLCFEPGHPSRIGLLPRRPSPAQQPIWFNVETCYIFHTVNAWDEDEDTVVLIAIASNLIPFELFDSDFARLPADAMLRTLEQSTNSQLRQYTFHLAQGTVEELLLPARRCEFPRVPPSLQCHPARYFYASYFTDSTKKTAHLAGLFKFDRLANTEVASFAFGENTFGGECCFVPKTNIIEPSEDDGYLLVFVTNETVMQSALLVLDARNLELVSKLPTPQRVPYGFHGNWVSQAQIDSQ